MTYPMGSPVAEKTSTYFGSWSMLVMLEAAQFRGGVEKCGKANHKPNHKPTIFGTACKMKGSSSKMLHVGHAKWKAPGRAGVFLATLCHYAIISQFGPRFFFFRPV